MSERIHGLICVIVVIALSCNFHQRDRKTRLRVRRRTLQVTQFGTSPPLTPLNGHGRKKERRRANNGAGGRAGGGRVKSSWSSSPPSSERKSAHWQLVGEIPPRWGNRPKFLVRFELSGEIKPVPTHYVNTSCSSTTIELEISSECSSPTGNCGRVRV